MTPEEMEAIDVLPLKRDKIDNLEWGSYYDMVD